jgi:hypothetical protein
VTANEIRDDFHWMLPSRYNTTRNPRPSPLSKQHESPKKKSTSKLHNWRFAIMRARAQCLGNGAGTRPGVRRVRGCEGIRAGRGSAQAGA